MPKNFYKLLENPKKVMILDLGFLGDALHLIPPVWQIRKAWPHAEIHVMIAEHAVGLLELFPWIDVAHGYPRMPKGPKWYKELPRVRGLRSHHFDTLINFSASHRSSLLSFLSGTPLRLGRINAKKKWGYYFTHTYWEEFGKELVCEQRLKILKKAGFPFSDEKLSILFPNHVNEWASKENLLEKPYLHISPFTTEDYKELPPNQLIHLLNDLNNTWQNSIVLSCSGANRELNKMTTLLSQLNFEPWKIYRGNLSIPQYASLIQHSRMHLGGDSGGLHLANTLDRPSFCWFRKYPNMAEWIPTTPKHCITIGRATPEGIVGISDKELLERLNKHLSLVLER